MPWNDWLEVVRFVRSLDRRRYNGRFEFTDADIVLTFLWATLHRRSVFWACRSDAWPIFVRHVARPSPTRVSRRLRDESAAALLEAVLQRVLHSGHHTPLVDIADGKAITVASHSRDRDATFGHFGMRGYKLHAVCDISGRIRARRLTPLHCYEPTIAGRLVRDLKPSGYLLADANYDHTELHGRCAATGAQLVAPRSNARRGRGTRRTGVPPSRRRAIDMIELDPTGFGRKLFNLRRTIERVFGRLETRFGINRPPAWIRTLPRVRRWIDAILILDAFTRPAAAG